MHEDILPEQQLTSTLTVLHIP